MHRNHAVVAARRARLDWFATPTAVFGVCVAIGLFTGLEKYSELRELGSSASAESTIVPHMALWVAWGALLPAIVFASRRIGTLATLGARIAAHASVAVALSLVNSVIVFAARAGVVWGSGGEAVHYRSIARGWLLFNLVTYAGLVAAVLAAEHWRRRRDDAVHTARLAAELSQARLRALEMQLNPHFLFNALNTVAMLCRVNDSPAAVETIARLSGLLRELVNEDTAQEVALGDELALLSRYLDIEAVRFQDRLRVRIDVPQELRTALVPRFILQPLVENAIRHGIAPHSQAGLLTIGARRSADELHLVVTDDGLGMQTGERSGVGLRNTRERLRGLYGDGARLDLTRPSGAGTVARIEMPWHTDARGVNGYPRDQVAAGPV